MSPRAGDNVTIGPQAAQRGRRRDLDRLRIAACLSTFCYHAVQVFDLNPYYHLKSNTLSPTIDVAARLLHAVRMPLFFLIAGMVAVLAFQRQTDGAFIRQRAKRLMLPFVVGIVLFTPWIKYLELADGRNINLFGLADWPGGAPELLVFLRRYFTQPRWFSWSHMWFPLYLLLLSALLLPAMRQMAARGAVSPTPGAVQVGLALAVPLAALVAIELLLRPHFPHHLPNLISDWASASVYVVVMLAGAAFMSWPGLERAVQRLLPVSLVLAGVGAWLYLGFSDWPWRGTGRALYLWGGLCLVVGLGPILARGRIAGETYFADAVLPLYVLHHLPLLLIAAFVKDLPWPIWQRYVVIVLGSFGVALVVYHLVVRPFEVVRFAFGLPPRGSRS